MSQRLLLATVVLVAALIGANFSVLKITASTAYLIPLFGVFFGWLVRDEVLGVVEAFGGLLVVVGVYVVVSANARAASPEIP